MYLSPFATELVKLSASVDELQAAYRRVNPTKAPARTAAGQMVQQAGGGITMPAMSSLKDPRVVVQHATGFGVDPATVVGLRRQIEAGVGGHAGNIYSSTGGAVRTQDALRRAGAPIPALATGQGQRAVNISTGLHEGYERAVKPHQRAPAFGHYSPEVLMKEHNMLQKMTGPGSAEARTYFRGLRAGAGDSPALMSTVRELYGPRGVEYVKEHGFSKAMRKNLTQNVRAGNQSSWPAATPEQLDNATKAVKRGPGEGMRTAVTKQKQGLVRSRRAARKTMRRAAQLAKSDRLRRALMTVR